MLRASRVPAVVERLRMCDLEFKITFNHLTHHKRSSDALALTTYTSLTLTLFSA